MKEKPTTEERLIARTFFLEAKQDEWLTRIAQIKKMTKSELLRMAVDDVIEKLATEILAEREREAARQQELERQRAEEEAQRKAKARTPKPKKLKA